MYAQQIKGYVHTVETKKDELLFNDEGSEDLGKSVKKKIKLTMIVFCV